MKSKLFSRHDSSDDDEACHTKGGAATKKPFLFSGLQGKSVVDGSNIASFISPRPRLTQRLNEEMSADSQEDKDIDDSFVGTESRAYATIRPIENNVKSNHPAVAPRKRPRTSAPNTLTVKDLLSSGDGLMVPQQQSHPRAACHTHSMTKKCKDDDWLESDSDEANDNEIHAVSGENGSTSHRSLSSSSSSGVRSSSTANKDVISGGQEELHESYSFLPAFSAKWKQEDAPLLLPGGGGLRDHKVHRYAARHLYDHQVVAVQWLWGKYCAKQGAILGDDMGMGKTISVAALFLAVYEKTGLPEDVKSLRSRRNLVASGEPTTTSTTVCNSSYASLVVCPASVVANWRQELTTWGAFSIEILGKAGKEADEQMDRTRNGLVEVLIMSYDKLAQNINQLKNIAWNIVVLDEAHQLKNSRTLLYKAVLSLKHARVRFGLTGTPIQNRLGELWALLYLLHNKNFMDRQQFRDDFEAPIKRSLSKKASLEAIATGKKRADVLRNLLARVMLSRRKESLVGEDQLKGKLDHIVLCDLSPLQRRLYEHVLSLPDFDNVRFHNSPCPCGGSQQLVKRRMDTTRNGDADDIGENDPPLRKKQKGSKRSTHEAIRRSRCCEEYLIPLRREGGSSGHIRKHYRNCDIDERAVIWRRKHPGGQRCEKCPTCVLLPCITKLIQIASHPALLQVDRNSAIENRKSRDRHSLRTSTNGDVSSDDDEQGAENGRKAAEAEDADADADADADLISFAAVKAFAAKAIGEPLLAELGGLYRSSRFEDKYKPDNSGKMMVLKQMLSVFTSRGEKTLVFSYSTKVMDIIEDFLKGQGWQFRRLDGSTPVRQRQKLVNEFNNTISNVQIFLSSSKAGGLGLNLKAACKVIIFDVHWNPSVDLQSQDRAYRIGQTEMVSVYRLVAKGTVEEIIYMRQLYKQELQKTILDNPLDILADLDDQQDNSRNFVGVEGDASCRGELFGVENLMQFSTQSILQSLRVKYSSQLVDSHKAVRQTTMGGGVAAKPTTTGQTQSGDQANNLLRLGSTLNSRRSFGSGSSREMIPYSMLAAEALGFVKLEMGQQASKEEAMETTMESASAEINNSLHGNLQNENPPHVLVPTEATNNSPFYKSKLMKRPRPTRTLRERLAQALLSDDEFSSDSLGDDDVEDKDRANIGRVEMPAEETASVDEPKKETVVVAYQPTENAAETETNTRSISKASATTKKSVTSNSSSSSTSKARLALHRPTYL